MIYLPLRKCHSSSLRTFFKPFLTCCLAAPITRMWSFRVLPICTITEEGNVMHSHKRIYYGTKTFFSQVELFLRWIIHIFRRIPTFRFGADSAHCVKNPGFTPKLLDQTQHCMIIGVRIQFRIDYPHFSASFWTKMIFGTWFGYNKM